MTDKKTMKQIANELGVSKQAIFQKLKRNPELNDKMKTLMTTVDGVIMVDVDGVDAIKSAFGQHCSDNVVSNVDSSGLQSALQTTITVLQEQLQTKDKQIEQLTAALQSAQETQQQLTSALTAAQALHAGTIQQQLEDKQNTETENKSFWNKLFKKS